MATISDVAARAGVGAGTVSRVLNNSPRVRPETRERVLAAIAALDYRPNPLAQRLSRGRCQTLGVVVPFFTHASAVERLRGVVAALDGRRYDLVLFNVESPLHRDEHFATLTHGGRADGLLVLSLPPPADDLSRLNAAGMPIVLVDTSAEGVPVVATDDIEGGRLATQHLLDLGHRSIAFIGEDPDNPLGFTASANREVGYEICLQNAGIQRDPRLTRYGPHDRDAAQQLAANLLAGEIRPSAFFTSSDVQAVGVLAAARELGMGVPEDLSLVGFDDIELSAYAGLTTVHQPLFESGHLGAELLLEALEGDAQPAPVVHEMPLELVQRATTAPYVERAA
jgi:LacI family transcriptional regulator, galactose operon repressor